MQIPQLAGLLPATSQDAAPVAVDLVESGFANAFDALQAPIAPTPVISHPVMDVPQIMVGKSSGREQLIAHFGLTFTEVTQPKTDIPVESEAGILAQMAALKVSPAFELKRQMNEAVLADVLPAPEATLAAEIASISPIQSVPAKIAADPAAVIPTKVPEQKGRDVVPSSSAIQTATAQYTSANAPANKLVMHTTVAANAEVSPAAVAVHADNAHKLGAAPDAQRAEPTSTPPKSAQPDVAPKGSAIEPALIASQVHVSNSIEFKPEHGKAASREAPEVSSEIRPAKPDTPDIAAKAALSGTPDMAKPPASKTADTIVAEPVEVSADAANTGESKPDRPTKAPHGLAGIAIPETLQTTPEKVPTATPSGIPQAPAEQLAKQTDLRPEHTESKPIALSAFGAAAPSPAPKFSKGETRDTKPSAGRESIELTAQTEIASDAPRENVAKREPQYSASDSSQNDKPTFVPMTLAEAAPAQDSTEMDANSALRQVDGTAPLSEGRASAPVASAPPAAHHSAQVLSQMAEAAKALGDRPVELTLNPEELGRVRMTLHTTNGEMAIAVTAERPETLDLIRRNLNDLAAQFRDIGFRDVSFSLGQQGSGQASPDQSQAGQKPARFDMADAVAGPEPLAPHSLNISSSGGMDIRL